MLRKARVEDVPKIKQLISTYAQQEKMLPQSIGELYEHIRDFHVIESKGKIIACGALRVTWEDYGEILSLAVSPDPGGRGSALDPPCLEPETLSLISVALAIVLSRLNSFTKSSALKPFVYFNESICICGVDLESALVISIIRLITLGSFVPLFLMR